MKELTVDEELKIAKRKSAKPMLWVAMISMVMFFAGLTSAYVISMNREDWVSFDLPSSLYISTLCIVLSSITIFFSQKFLKQDKLSTSFLLLIATFILGLAFIWFQYDGFLELKSKGLYFTGKQSIEC